MSKVCRLLAPSVLFVVNNAKHNKSMVPCVSQVMSKTKTFPLNQNLTCANYGIDAATCVICHKQYVGQTKNKFSKRWSSHGSHRSNWNRPNCEIDKNDKDKVALSWHYSVFHGNVNKPSIHEAYTVTFVEQPNFHSLSIFEDKWYHKPDAQVNIQNMILPTWDKLCALSYGALTCFNFRRHYVAFWFQYLRDLYN